MRTLKLKGWVGWHPKGSKYITIYAKDAEVWRQMGMKVVPVLIVERKES